MVGWELIAPIVVEILRSRLERKAGLKSINRTRGMLRYNIYYIWFMDINRLGLILDFFGFLLLFFYGLPSNVNKGGRGGIVQASVDNAEVSKWKRYRVLSVIGCVLVSVGFILQILVTIPNSDNPTDGEGKCANK